MTNITVSNDVDDFMQSADKAAMRSSINADYTTTGTASALATTNAVVPAGQRVYETNTDIERVGDGVSKHTQLTPNPVGLAGRKVPIRTSKHIPTTAGAVGSTTTSGNAMSVTGADLSGVAVHADRYISGSTNAYIYVNSGAAIRRVTQKFSGTTGAQAVIAILVSNAFGSDMLHVEFGASGIVPTLWQGGVAAIQPQCSYVINTPPSIADDQIHELTVEVFGDYCLSLIDGIPCHLAFDTRISEVVGNWYYTQLTATTSKIHGFESYSNNLEELPVSLPALHIGKNVAGFAPLETDSIYARTGSKKIRFSAEAGLDLIVEATGNGGIGSRIIAKNQFGHELVLNAETNATASLTYQGTKYISIANSGRLSFSYPLHGTAIANATDAASAITQLNALLAALRTAGVIAT
jgi:hypothetical protein